MRVGSWGSVNETWCTWQTVSNSYLSVGACMCEIVLSVYKLGGYHTPRVVHREQRYSNSGVDSIVYVGWTDATRPACSWWWLYSPSPVQVSLWWYICIQAGGVHIVPC
jgi:hypothetical protein